MKKAVIVGGSNGIGLAIAKKLIETGYYVNIVDKSEPDFSLQSVDDQCKFLQCDLIDFDVSVFDQMAADLDVQLLFITAGYGRVADFEYFHTAEIKRMIEVNSIASLQIIRKFYHRIKAQKPFYCGVMGSIAGLISSPMFSVYAASKAAVCRFTESVNAELSCSETTNRILNVSPGSVGGTRFNGGRNQLEVLEPLAEEILNQLFSGTELYIPQYDTVFRDVIARYHADPAEFGRDSYQYKRESGRAQNERKVRIGYLSGTFDLFHIGHLNLLRRAKAECDYLIVGVHPNASHKGKETFIPFEERKAIVASIRYVDKVIESMPEDSDVWEKWHYTKLFVGSDYKGTERFNRYESFFSDKGVEIVYFPYTQGTSSTQLRERMTKDNS